MNSCRNVVVVCICVCFQLICLSQQINCTKASLHSLLSARSVDKTVNPKPDRLSYLDVHSIHTHVHTQSSQDYRTTTSRQAAQTRGFHLKQFSNQTRISLTDKWFLTQKGNCCWPVKCIQGSITSLMVAKFVTLILYTIEGCGSAFWEAEIWSFIFTWTVM